MATRYYINNAAAGISPTVKGTWTETDGAAQIKQMGTAKSGGAGTYAGGRGAAGTWTELVAIFVSDPIGATSFSTSHTVTGVVGAAISSTTNTGATFDYYIYVTQGDSTSSVRGVLASNVLDSVAWSATATGRGASVFSLANNVSALNGDRIVVEIGFQKTGTSTSTRTGTINYGNAGATDLTNGNTSVTTRPGWIEFSTTVASYNTPPSVSLTTPSDTGTVSSTTPDLVFTGTDANSDTITYAIQVDTIPSFNSTVVLSDTFDGLVLDTGKWAAHTTTGATVTQNNELLLQCLATSTGNAYVTSVSTYNFSTGLSMWCYSSQLDTAGKVDNVMKIVAGGSEEYQIGVYGGNTKVRGQVYESGSGDPGFDGPTYNSSSYWWMLRYADASIQFCTSSDGIAWTQFASFVPGGGVNFSACTIYLHQNEWSSQTPITAFKLDNFYLRSTPLLSKLSATPSDILFSGTPDNTDPFNSAQAVTFTVQGSDALTDTVTYYWRVRGKDPSGTNTWGNWTTPYSFTVSVSAPATTVDYVRTLMLMGVGL